MKNFGTKHDPAIPARNEEMCLDATCDLCGVIRTNGPPICSSGECNWSHEPYEVLETTVAMITGSRYPEGGSQEVTSFQVCPKCFKEILIPLIKNFARTHVTKERFPESQLTQDTIDF